MRSGADEMCLVFGRALRHPAVIAFDLRLDGRRFSLRYRVA